jgi:hypothetical protein
MWAESAWAWNLILQILLQYFPAFRYSDFPFPSPLPPGGGRGGGRGSTWGGGGGNILYSKNFTYYEQHPINNILKLLGVLELTANLHSTQTLRTILRLFPGFLLPRGRIRGKLTPALLPFRLTRGLGLGVGLAGSFPGSRSCLRAGGVGDQGTTLTHDTLLTRPALDVLGNQGIRINLNPNLRRIVGFFLTLLAPYPPSKAYSR